MTELQKFTLENKSEIMQIMLLQLEAHRAKQKFLEAKERLQVKMELKHIQKVSIPEGTITFAPEANQESMDVKRFKQDYPSLFILYSRSSYRESHLVVRRKSI